MKTGGEKVLSQPPPPPQLSPDGKFYWDGARWVAFVPSAEPKPFEGSNKGGCVIVTIIALAIVVFGASSTCGSGFDVTVTNWSQGSADVTGTIKNNRSGCSAPEIVLHLKDRNDAIVRDFALGAGELAAGQQRAWTTHLVGVLMLDAPVEANVTAITADATCTDSH